MTIGKVTKKDSRLFARSYKFMKKNSKNLTLKDFADLIEFMNESDERGNNGNSQQSAMARHFNRPILGLGHFLNQRNLNPRINYSGLRSNNQPSRPNNQAQRLNNQVPNPAANRQRTAITYKRNDWPAPPEPEKRGPNDHPIQPPGGRVKVEYIEQ